MIFPCGRNRFSRVDLPPVGNKVCENLIFFVWVTHPHQKKRSKQKKKKIKSFPRTLIQQPPPPPTAFPRPLPSSQRSLMTDPDARGWKTAIATAAVVPWSPVTDPPSSRWQATDPPSPWWPATDPPSPRWQATDPVSSRRPAMDPPYPWWPATDPLRRHTCPDTSQ